MINNWGLSLLPVLTGVLLAACGSDTNSSGSASVPPANAGGTPAPSSAQLPAATRALGIESVPSALAGTYTGALKFNRYTKVVAANGKAIHLVAQDALTDGQIVRARAVLEHYLTPLPTSAYGADKTAVANAMADNGAVLLLLNGSDDGTNAAAELGGQPLYQNEIQVEGHAWYINQNYDEHRDATFEEILHLIHDYGIGVDQNARFVGALPEFQGEIRSAQIDALNQQTWGVGAADWIAELTAENSLSQEYLAAVVDSYYGLWGAWTGSKTQGMWGLYAAKTRDDIATADPLGAALMNDRFFHPYLTYNARIDAGFSGDFSLRFNPALPYSHHARYLKDVTLTGSLEANVVVNQLDNDITGNSGHNRVIFSGSSSEYSIEPQADGSTLVTDQVTGRDGRNRLRGIETAVFSDAEVAIGNG